MSYQQNSSRLRRLPDFFGITDSSGLTPLSRIWDNGVINNGLRKTVAELEEQSKTGTPISLLELAQAVQRENEEKRREQQPVRREKSGEKPSIIAKLKASSVADTKSVKSAPKRSAEREL